MNDSTTHGKRKTRRWLRFRLRTMFLLVVLFAVVLAVGVSVVPRWRRAERQRKAVMTVRGLGGKVYYDYEFEGDERKDLPKQPGPEWQRRWLGVDYFADVVEVDLHETKTTDRDLRMLSGFPKLKRLSLRITPVTDVGLAQLVHTPRLYELDLGGFRIGDKGMVHVAQLRELRFLDLRSTHVGDEGLMQLAGLSRLQRVTINGGTTTWEGEHAFEAKAGEILFIYKGRNLRARRLMNEAIRRLLRKRKSQSGTEGDKQ